MGKIILIPPVRMNRELTNVNYSEQKLVLSQYAMFTPKVKHISL